MKAPSTILVLLLGNVCFPARNQSKHFGNRAREGNPLGVSTQRIFKGDETSQVFISALTFWYFPSDTCITVNDRFRSTRADPRHAVLLGAGARRDRLPAETGVPKNKMVSECRSPYPEGEWERGRFRSELSYVGETQSQIDNFPLNCHWVISLSTSTFDMCILYESRQRSVVLTEGILKPCITLLLIGEGGCMVCQCSCVLLREVHRFPLDFSPLDILCF